MKITRENVIYVLITMLQETQRDIVEDSEIISEETKPIGDLFNFDSLTSVEVTVNTLEALGFEEFPSCPTLFIGKNQEALTVGQVADRILNLNLKCNQEQTYAK